MSILVSDILYDALRLSGVVQMAGRGASTTELADAFRTLNSLIDSWNYQRLTVYTISRGSPFTLTANTQDFTVGPAQDFAFTVRPVHIDGASYLFSGATLERELQIVTAEEWAAMPFKNETSNIGPRFLWYEKSFPTAYCHFLPIQTSTLALYLRVWSQLAQYTAQSDTVTLPPAYQRALTYNLALDIGGSPRFVRGPMDPTVPALAAQSKAEIEAMNARLTFGQTPEAAQ